ncbi:hypothetical protein D3C77_646660 [compost metagenome]
MLNDDIIAVRAVFVGCDHFTRTSGIYGITSFPSDIDAGMEGSTSLERIGSVTEIRCDRLR